MFKSTAIPAGLVYSTQNHCSTDEVSTLILTSSALHGERSEPARPGLVDTGNNFPAVTEYRQEFASILEGQIHLNRSRRLRRLRHGVAAAADVVKLVRPGWSASMITMTLRPGVEPGGEVSPSFLLKRLQRYARAKWGQELPYVWVAELTRRGVVHWHLLVWHPPLSKVPHPDRKGWWPYGHTRVDAAFRPAGYLAKYASKGANEVDLGASYPKGLRITGYGGISGLARGFIRWAMRPMWLRKATTPYQSIRRVQGGFLCLDTGEFLRSPWERTWDYLAGGRVCLVLSKRAGPDTATLSADVLLWGSFPRRWQDRERWLKAYLENHLIPGGIGPPC